VNVVDGTVLNPVDIEAAIRTCSDRIHAGVKVCTKAEEKSREASRIYDRAFAQAYLKAEGPAHEKKYRAELLTGRERDALDVAELAYRHAERTAKAIEAELRAWQSVGASVRAMFGAQR
jgi:hypothetical protein